MSAAYAPNREATNHGPAYQGPAHRPGYALTDTGVMIARSLRRSVRDPEAFITALALPVTLMLLFVYVFGGAFNAGVEAGGRLRQLRGARPDRAVRRLRRRHHGGRGRDRHEQRHRRPVPLDADRRLDGPRGADRGQRRPQPPGDGAGDRRRPRHRLAADGRARSPGSPRSALIVLFIAALSWLAACFGLLVGSPEAANGATFILMFIPYLSTAFVPAGTMTRVLRPVAANQPFTPLIEAMRGLWMGHTSTGAVRRPRGAARRRLLRRHPRPRRRPGRLALPAPHGRRLSVHGPERPGVLALGHPGYRTCCLWVPHGP